MKRWTRPPMAFRRAILVAAFLVVTTMAPRQAHAQLTPDYSDSAGQWTIVGSIAGGNTILCKMQKVGQGGKPFAYIDILSVGGDGLQTKALFVTRSNFPEGTRPLVSLSFDGIKQVPLQAVVKAGLLDVVLPADDLQQLQHILQLLQFSDRLSEQAALKGFRTETLTVDLADSGPAFQKAGQCMKIVMGMAVEKMQADQR